MRVAMLHLSLYVFHSLSSSIGQAALRVLPNRSQFFQYESVSLSCGQQGNSSDWRVLRNTSRNTNQECINVGGLVNGFCIDTLYPSDSGVYWCESAAGERCDAVSITVIRGAVILQSPALPVKEGDDVTLSCRKRTKSSSTLTADFYKDGLLIGSSSTGSMTLRSVSQSDEGVYKCNISGAGESPGSRLTVTSFSSAPVTAFSVLRHAVVATPYLLSTIILGLKYRDIRRAPLLVAVDRSHDVIWQWSK